MPGSEFEFRADDGESVLARRWLPEGSPRGIVQIAHGLTEHSARYARLAAALNAAGYAVYASDLRGHGPKAAAADLGHFADEGGWRKVVGDLWAMNRLIAKEQCRTFRSSSSAIRWARSSVAGSSPSIPTRWPGRRFRGRAASRRRLRRWAASSPAKSGCAWASAARVRSPSRCVVRRLQQAVQARPHQPSTWLSRDEKEVDAFVADPLCGFPFTTQGGHRRARRLALALSRAGRSLALIRKDMPVYVFSGERDPVGANIQGPIGDLEAGGFTRLTTRIYPGAPARDAQRDQPRRGDSRPHRLARRGGRATINASKRQ